MRQVVTCACGVKVNVDALNNHWKSRLHANKLKEGKDEYLGADAVKKRQIIHKLLNKLD